MKVTQVSKHIWCLKTWVAIPIRVWVVVEEEGVTLVDTGIPLMANRILSFIERLQAGPLQKVLLTHGHSDHVGAIKRIVKVTPVPIYAHRTEIPYIEGDLPYPRRKKAKSVIDRGRVRALEDNKNTKIQQIGTLTPYHTPGHSPGHIVYHHEKDQVLLAGDLFTSKKGMLHRPMPMFTADMGEAIRSSSILRSLQPKRVEVCHGNPVFQALDQLDEYISKTSKAFNHEM